MKVETHDTLKSHHSSGFLRSDYEAAKKSGAWGALAKTGKDKEGGKKRGRREGDF